MDDVVKDGRGARVSLELSEDRAARYRALAAEARELAAQVDSPATLAAMLEVAATWDRVAHLEDIDMERKTSRS